MQTNTSSQLLEQRQNRFNSSSRFTSDRVSPTCKRLAHIHKILSQLSETVCERKKRVKRQKSEQQAVLEVSVLGRGHRSEFFLLTFKILSNLHQNLIKFLHSKEILSHMSKNCWNYCKNCRENPLTVCVQTSCPLEYVFLISAQKDWHDFTLHKCRLCKKTAERVMRQIGVKIACAIRTWRCLPSKFVIKMQIL